VEAKMSDKKIGKKVKKSYMLIEDDEGWKVLTDRGLHSLIGIDGESVQISFSSAVTAKFSSGVRGVVDGESIKEATESLIDDGYKPYEIKKMSLRQEIIADVR